MDNVSLVIWFLLVLCNYIESLFFRCQNLLKNIMGAGGEPLKKIYIARAFRQPFHLAIIGCKYFGACKTSLCELQITTK